MSNHQISSIFCLFIYLHIEVAVFGARAAPSTFARGHLKQWDLDLEWRRTRCPWQAKASKCPRRPRLNGGKVGKNDKQHLIEVNVRTYILKIQPKCFFSVVYRFLAPLSPMYWLIDFRHFMAHCHAIPRRRAAITPSIPYLRSAICAGGAMGHGLVGWPHIL